MRAPPYIVRFSEGREPDVFHRDEAASKKLSETVTAPYHRREQPVSTTTSLTTLEQHADLAKRLDTLEKVAALVFTEVLTKPTALANRQRLSEYKADYGDRAGEFTRRVEAEKAKGLTDVEALRIVAGEYPEFYNAYRNEAFIDGSI
jgi:hypothetical protein